jgi:hypothetical protein
MLALVMALGLVHLAFEPVTGVDGRIGTVVQRLTQPAQVLEGVKDIATAGHLRPSQRLAGAQAFAAVGDSIIRL